MHCGELDIKDGLRGTVEMQRSIGKDFQIGIELLGLGGETQLSTNER